LTFVLEIHSQIGRRRKYKGGRQASAVEVVSGQRAATN